MNTNSDLCDASVTEVWCEILCYIELCYNGT